jgi:hypothetical protein
MAACVAIGAPAAAQEGRPKGGPFSGLFTGSPKDQPHTLDLSGSAFAAWDDNPLAQGFGGAEGFATDPRVVKQGLANGFQGALVYGYHKSGTRSQFAANANAGFQQFASAGSGALWFQSYGVSTGLTTKVSNKTFLSLGGGSSYAPYYQYAPFLRSTITEESPVGTDYGFAVNSQWVRSASASASIENRFSKKSAISAGVDWQQRVMPENPQADLDMRTARLQFRHNVTRKLGFHVGYGIQESRYSYPGAEPTRAHIMDIGLDYTDGLTVNINRRTQLSFLIGASLAKNGDPRSIVATGQETRFVVTGSATLGRSIGRTWSASVGYNRGTFYMVGFPQPMITDSANAGIGGQIVPRLHFSLGAGASRGQQLFSTAGEDAKIVTYSASSRLTYALFTHLGLYTQASYYRFSIPPGFTNFGFIPLLQRRSVSAGLTTWLPLIKPRRGTAS